MPIRKLRVILIETTTQKYRNYRWERQLGLSGSHSGCLTNYRDTNPSNIYSGVCSLVVYTVPERKANRSRKLKWKNHRTVYYKSKIILFVKLEMNRSTERQGMRSRELIFVWYEKRMENVHVSAWVKKVRHFFRDLAS